MNCHPFRIALLIAGAALLTGVPSTLSLSRASAKERAGQNLGIGVIFGDPSGLSVRQDQGISRSWDMMLAFDWDRSLELTANPTWIFQDLFSKRDSRLKDLRPYLGLGGALVLYGDDTARRWRNEKTDSDTDLSLGLRIPIGIEWRMTDAPLSIFAEIAPGIGIVPGTFTFVEGGVGIRYLL